MFLPIYVFVLVACLLPLYSLWLDKPVKTHCITMERKWWKHDQS